MFLMETIREERGLTADRQVAIAVGLDPSYAQRIRENVTQPGLEQLDKVCRKLSLAPTFFTDPSIGDAPDYRAFLGREARVERDDERHEVVEAFIVEQRLEAELAEDLRRQVRAAGGRFVRDELLMLLPAIRMRAARLRAEAAGEPDPAPRELPAVPEGRRRVPPGKKGRP
jgi:transcriptional regulator with XRE-family HTH domain